MTRKTKLLGKADRYLTKTAAAVAAATAAGLCGTAQPAQAGIVYSGTVNIPIPNDIDGVYFNLVTGVGGSTPPAGWDINPYSAVAGQFNLWAANTTTWFAPVLAGPYPQVAGTLISNAGTFFRPGGGTDVGLQVTLNAPNYFGVQFLNEGTSATNYGWVEITFGATAADRAITGYAYEDTGAGINVAAVPEPTSLSLLAMGATGLYLRRRRNAAKTTV